MELAGHYHYTAAALPAGHYTNLFLSNSNEQQPITGTRTSTAGFREKNSTADENDNRRSSENI